MAKRKRRAFTKEFKAQAVRIVRESGKPIVAWELDLTETALRSGVRQAAIDDGGGTGGALTTAEREELGHQQLRGERVQQRVGRERGMRIDLSENRSERRQSASLARVPGSGKKDVPGW